MAMKKIALAAGALYALLLFTGLTLWRLPLERLIPFFGETLSSGHILCNVERARLSFPLEFHLDNFSYTMAGERGFPVDLLDRLILRVNPFGWIVGSMPILFRAYSDTESYAIQGSASIPLSGKRGSLEFTASGVELGQMRIFQSLLGRDLKGKASGEVGLSWNFSDASDLSGQGRILIEKGSIGGGIDLLGMKAIPFDVLQIPFMAEHGRVLLEKAEIKGPMLSGALNGHIQLKPALGESTLSLAARVRLGSLPKENTPASTSKIRKGSEEYVMRIEGSLQNPTLVME